MFLKTVLGDFLPIWMLLYRYKSQVWSERLFLAIFYSSELHNFLQVSQISPKLHAALKPDIFFILYYFIRKCIWAHIQKMLAKFVKFLVLGVPWHGTLRQVVPPPPPKKKRRLDPPVTVTCHTFSRACKINTCGLQPPKGVNPRSAGRHQPNKHRRGRGLPLPLLPYLPPLLSSEPRVAQGRARRRTKSLTNMILISA